LQSARRKNAAHQITGLLLYDGRRFLQTLEGPAFAVSDTFFRIKADRRHRAIVQLSSDIDERAFSSWAMAAQRIGVAGSVVEQVDTLTMHVKDRNLRETFRSFADIRAAA
jgi:hypothetical protein